MFLLMISVTNQDGYIVNDALFGNTIVEPQVLCDENGFPGCFFVFTDISIKVAGFFRFQFDLINID